MPMQLIGCPREAYNIGQKGNYCLSQIPIRLRAPILREDAVFIELMPVLSGENRDYESPISADFCEPATCEHRAAHEHDPDRSAYLPVALHPPRDLRGLLAAQLVVYAIGNIGIQARRRGVR